MIEEHVSGASKLTINKSDFEAKRTDIVLGGKSGQRKEEVLEH